jgi:hypothetical protein
MRVLLCILFALVWPIGIWVITASALSFVFWGNYFVMSFQEWGELTRFMFIMAWLAGVICCVGQLLTYKLESK